MTDARDDEEKTRRRAVRWACISLVAFSALTALALAAFFKSSESPWRLASFIATVSALGALVTCVLVFRAPSRKTVGAGIGVMLFSLLRALPGSWSSSTYALVAITAVLLIPLVHAVIILPRSTR